MENTRLYLNHGIEPVISLCMTMGIFSISGHSILRSTLAVEKLGSWKSGCVENGPQSWYYLWSGEKIEKETSNRVYVFKSKTS